MPASLSFKQQDRSTNATSLNEVKTIIYEDDTGNKYTFGVDTTSVFNTFRYEPSGAAEIDYSATATKFMTGGAIATLLDIGTNVGAIKTKTDKMPADLGTDLTTIKTETDKIAAIGTNVDAIKTKTDKMPADLGADVTTIKTQVGTDLISRIKTETDKIAAIGTNVGAIKTKTDTIPANLGADVTAIKTQVGTDLISGIKAKTDKMPADLNNELGKLATSATLSTLDGKVDTITTETDKIAAIGTNVDEIKTKTDTIPDDLGAELDKLAKSAELDPLAKTAELAPLVAPLAKTAELDPLAKTAELAPLVAPLAKTAELDPLAKTAELAPLVAPLAKTAELDPLAKTAELVPLAKTTDVAAIKAKTDKMPDDLKAELIKLVTIGEAINGNGKVTEAAKAVLESSFKQAITDAGQDGSEWLKTEIKGIVSQPSFEIPASDDAALNWTW